MKKLYSFFVASLFSVLFLSAAPTTGLQFSGVATSYIDLGSQVAFSPTAFTIETWVYYQNLSGGYIISNEGWSPTNQGFSFRPFGNKLEFAYGEGANWHTLQSTTDIPLNTWFHAAVTYSATAVKLYINGVEEATAAVTTAMVASTQNTSIAEGSAWKGRLFTGKLADLRFWNVVRTPAEIAANMSTSLNGTETGLVANWKMNEGTGTVVADVKGAYNITKPADVAWFIPTLEQEISIVEPTKGLIFNGMANSLVDLGSNAAITSPTEYTIEAVVNFTSVTGGYVLASEGWGTGGMGYALRIDNNRINFNTGTNTTWTGVTAPTNVALNAWTHIAVTFSAAKMALYVNGLEVASLASPTPMVASTQNLIMGEGAMWRSRGLIGKLGYVRMWSVAKTKQEIRDNANNYVTGTEANLIAAWNNNVKDATVLADKKATYPGAIGSDVQWFGLFTDVNPVQNSTKIESVLSGRTLEVTNNTASTLSLSVYSITGQKVVSATMRTGAKFEKQLNNPKGSYILRAVAEDGSTYTKKFIIAE